MTATDPIRIQASRALLAVKGGQSLDAALAQEVDRDHAQAGLGRALVYAALRHAWSGAALLKRLRTTPGRAPRPPIAAVLDIGLAELRFLATPQHAAVSESVSAARALEAASSGFVNALLRRYLRERDELEAAILADPEARYDHPQWLIDQFRADWPDDWQGLLAAGNRAAPMWLRVDARSGSRAAYHARLAALGIEAHAPDTPPYALRLGEATGVDRLPGFSQGLVSVQDAAAQRVVDALDARPGQRVLDACAAPGGKTAALAERVADLEIVAIERDPARARRLTDTLTRCRVDARVLVEDACQVARWWDGRPFDRILIDAPCSGTGVIRRHPDIKHHRRPADVPAQVRAQAQLLDALRPMLAPGGRLTYATCSIIRAENQLQIEKQMGDGTWETAARARSVWPALAPASQLPSPVAHRPSASQWQNLTGVNDEDGFYFASLQRLD